MPKKKEQDDDDVSSVDVDEEVNEVEDDEAANDLANADVVTKYQTAGKIANECLAKVIAACVPGTKAVTLCLVGDEVRLPRGARCAPPHASCSAPPRLAGHRGGHRQDLQRQGQGRQEDRQRPPSHGQSAPPPLGSGRPRRLRHLGAPPAALAWPTLPGEEAGPLVTAPLPRALELAASKAADATRPPATSPPAR